MPSPRRRTPASRDLNALVRLYAYRPTMNVGNALTYLGTEASRYQEAYNQLNGVMPLGYRASFLKSVDWPSSWGILYGLSPAQISQDRYAADVRRADGMANASMSRDISDEEKYAYWLLLLKMYIVGAGSAMEQGNFPSFRKPSWMTNRQKELIRDTIIVLYNVRTTGRSLSDVTPEAGASTSALPNLPDSPPRFNRANIETIAVSTAHGPKRVKLAPNNFRIILSNRLQNEESENVAGMVSSSVTLKNKIGRYFKEATSESRQWPESFRAANRPVMFRSTSAVIFRYPASGPGSSGNFEGFALITAIGCPRENIFEAPLWETRFEQRVDLPDSPHKLEKVGDDDYWFEEQGHFKPVLIRVAYYAVVSPGGAEMSQQLQPAQTLHSKMLNLLNASVLGGVPQYDGHNAAAILDAADDYVRGLQGGASSSEAQPTHPTPTETSAETATPAEMPLRIQRLHTADQAAVRVLAKRMYRMASNSQYSESRLTTNQQENQTSAQAVIQALAVLIKLDVQVYRSQFKQVTELGMLPAFVMGVNIRQFRFFKSRNLIGTGSSAVKMARIHWMQFNTNGIDEDMLRQKLLALATLAGTSSYSAETAMREAQAENPTDDLKNIVTILSMRQSQVEANTKIQVHVPVSLPENDDTRAEETLSNYIAQLDRDAEVREIYNYLLSVVEGAESSEEQLAVGEIPGTAQAQTSSSTSSDPMRALRMPLRNSSLGLSANDIFTSLGDSPVIIGMQTASPGMLFREGEKLLARSVTSRVPLSYIFYFAIRQQAPNNSLMTLDSWDSFDLFQSEFGQLPGGAETYGTESASALDVLRAAIEASGRLDSPNRLKIKRVPTINMPKVQRNLLGESVPFRPMRSRVESGTIELSSIYPMSDVTRQAFNVWANAMNATRPVGSASNTSTSTSDANNQHDELASGSTTPNRDEVQNVTTRLQQIKNQPMDRTFAFEIEGNWVNSGDSSTRVYQLKNAIKEVVAEKYQQESARKAMMKRFRINSGRGLTSVTIKTDGSVVGAGIEYGDGFETDTPIMVPASVDLGKTNANEALGADFETSKFDNDIDMWNWVTIFNEAMLRCGVRIHKSAGLHIHTSISDYRRADKKRYLENYAGFEPLFDLLMPVNSRKGGRSYNASIIQRGEITTGHQRGRSTPDPSPSRWRADGSTGRSKVRTETGIQTMEFRHPMTSISPDLIKHMIILAYSLVEVSKFHKFSEFKFKNLQSFLPVATATYLYNRIEEMAGPDVDTSFFVGQRGVDPELKRRNLE